jgi:ATP-dependent DNA helicase RecG
MSLATLLNRKIGLQFEVMPEPSGEALAELLVAFANSDGGTVLLGVTREGRITGNLLRDDAETSLGRALTLCKPAVTTEWQHFEDREGLVIAISVQRGSDTHTLADGRVMRRTNTGNEVLLGQQIGKLAATRATGNYEQEVVANAKREDLDDEVIGIYLTRRRSKMSRDARLTDDELLQGVGAITRDGKVTVAGLVLFGKNPEFFLPQVGLTYVRFPGTERLAGGHARYVNRKDFTGPLPRLLEDAWDELWRDLRKEAVVRGLVREEHYRLPQTAVREALVNALCHREYSVERRVEVHLFDNRLEITSPGKLPAWITLDNILYEHYSRNPRIVSALLEWKYIEELGLGIDQMFDVMQQAGHPIPDMREGDNSFSVVLWQADKASVPAIIQPLEVDPTLGLNERQFMALQHLARNERITNSTLRELCPRVSGETLRLDLAAMVDMGLLVRMGDRKGTYYILKQKTGK